MATKFKICQGSYPHYNIINDGKTCKLILGRDRWMRKLGYSNAEGENFVPLNYMSKKKSNQTREELERRIKSLENQLLDSQLKEEAYRRMIEIAEKDLKISIQKKPNTK